MSAPLVDRLRASLAVAPEAPPISGDLAELPAAGATPAAVLVAITDRPAPGLILTVRRDDMRTHAGQVAFPGGRIDPGEEAIAAALREADEELGLDPARAEVIAAVDPYLTVTGFAVTPVVAVIPPDLPLAPHEREVADWFEAPLAFVLDPSNQQRQSAVFAGRERRYWQIEWEGRKIWGATAAMLVNLSRRLRWS
ncbi:CoA pyrophosphatase [Sphingomonas sabuli]|uniref:CoA pyrophosphatase n=1 Tax=Sphingomonas sabuli TaxID=2764186 RepID=A0A7G9L4W5_9SPHN|nr:CoA pyrophosphatase [Sphingomonas sabuli]QNM83664.1 CoA pyrophosphatase [Sphingomonas sabuli]